MNSRWHSAKYCRRATDRKPHYHFRLFVAVLACCAMYGTGLFVYLMLNFWRVLR